MQLSVLRGGSRKSERGAGLVYRRGALLFSCEKFNGFGKTLAKNSMTKSMGPPPLLWLWRYHVPRTVKLSCRFHRYSCPARSSGSPCDCRNKQGRLGSPGLSVLGCSTKTHSFHRSMSCRFVRVCVCSGWSARSAISTHLRILKFRKHRRGYLSVWHNRCPSVF